MAFWAWSARVVITWPLGRGLPVWYIPGLGVPVYYTYNRLFGRGPPVGYGLYGRGTCPPVRYVPGFMGVGRGLSV